ncbi:hypothetical protein [Persicitalea sp.]|uniref:hypothetical protein n=1 Tax=Persicitalea sp. TaxID=3100273 RepID=UPI003593334F
MKKADTSPNLQFERLLWKNELEFNRREIAIFESYLLSLQGQILPQTLTELMSQLHDYLRSVDKLLGEIAAASRCPTDNIASDRRLTNWQSSEPECHYIREELFYFEQNYHQFKNQFCSFAAGLEAA